MFLLINIQECCNPLIKYCNHDLTAALMQHLQQHNTEKFMWENLETLFLSIAIFNKIIKKYSSAKNKLLGRITRATIHYKIIHLKLYRHIWLCCWHTQVDPGKVLKSNLRKAIITIFIVIFEWPLILQYNPG